MHVESRSQWPCGLRRRSSAARLLRLWVRIPPGAWMLVCCECCVLSGRGLCDGLITRLEESYRMWRVVVCDQETSKNEAKARYRAVKIQPQWVVTPGKQTNINVEKQYTEQYNTEHTDDDEMGVTSNVTMKISGYELSSLLE